ncbi:MAG: hypothetical protein WC264_00755 [Candidatus Paceibacterota bacterium]|jgi:hypothetical protein
MKKAVVYFRKIGKRIIFVIIIFLVVFNFSTESYAQKFNTKNLGYKTWVEMVDLNNDGLFDEYTVTQYAEDQDGNIIDSCCITLDGWSEKKYVSGYLCFVGDIMSAGANTYQSLREKIHVKHLSNGKIIRFVTCFDKPLKDYVLKTKAPCYAFGGYGAYSLEIKADDLLCKMEQGYEKDFLPNIVPKQ